MTATELGETIGRAILHLLGREGFMPKPCEGCDDETLGLTEGVSDDDVPGGIDVGGNGRDPEGVHGSRPA